MKITPTTIELTTGEGIAIHDLMNDINNAIKTSDIQNGFVTVTSQHTTTAIAINEYEERLLDDIRVFFEKLIPADNKYLHNDLHLRHDIPPDEPENAHSHLAAMLLGSSEVIPLIDGKLVLGQYQSVMLYELDGPRQRQISVQVYGK